MTLGSRSDIGREVVASAARTSSGNSGKLTPSWPAQQLQLFVDVTAVSGTPTLDLAVEWSPDGGSTWFPGDPADSFTQITAAKNVVERFAVKAPDYRIVWTIAGTTPSFTFAIDEYLN